MCVCVKEMECVGDCVRSEIALSYPVCFDGGEADYVYTHIRTRTHTHNGRRKRIKLVGLTPLPFDHIIVQ